MDFYKILSIVFIIAIIVQRAWEMFLKKPPHKNGEIYYGWTLIILIITYNIVILCAIAEIFFVERTVKLDIRITGLSLLIIAFIIRNWSIATLGNFHSTNIEIKEGHSLIRRGPYKYLRHPYYLSVMIEVASIPLTVQSIYTFYLVFIIYIPCVLMRVYLEEQVLQRTFGEEYEDYKSKVRAFIPLRPLKEERCS